MTTSDRPAEDLPAPLLRAADLHASLTDPSLGSMNLLNEVSERFPGAVSFAAGRPWEGAFDADLIPRYLDTYRRYLRETLGRSEEEVHRTLFQYGRTKGIVHELVARNLRTDEGIRVDPEAVVVTVGCQEAMYLVLRALRRDERDVLLAVSPTYVGITGAARLVDMPVLPVRSGAGGVDPTDLVATVREARAAGLRPRAFYVIPDFANPTGESLDLAARRGLLAIAQEHGLLLLEDNPYGLFRASGSRLPTLKALDEGHRVVYLGSFAKTGLPGARVGYAVADQPVAHEAGRRGLLADELSKIKSMVTVNTSSVAQAVIGGKLIEHDFSLVRANVRQTEIYARNLRHVLTGLAGRFPRQAGEAPVVRWNSPAGGFFVVLTVPFPVTDALLETSARQYGVIWTPMHHFYADDGGRYQLRLSCSLLDPPAIDEGLDRLAALLRDHLPPAGTIA
ncbi:aminotransferase-like domain-containing protein [Streptomyces sp. NPDC002559]